jgi:hypothetical protein
MTLYSTGIAGGRKSTLGQRIGGRPLVGGKKRSAKKSGAKKKKKSRKKKSKK